IRPGSVMTVRPPCWTSWRWSRKASSRRGSCAAAPGPIGVRAVVGAGAAGSGVVTCGGARRTKFGAPVCGVVWVPWPGVGVAVGGAEVVGAVGVGVAVGAGGVGRPAPGGGVRTEGAAVGGAVGVGAVCGGGGGGGVVGRTGAAEGGGGGFGAAGGGGGGAWR